MTRQIIRSIRNAERRIGRLETSGRYNTLADAIAASLALPVLRAFWPMSAVGNDASAVDLGGAARALTNNNVCPFGYDDLAPYVDFDGVNQYLSRADAGAAQWADITGTEAHVLAAQRGLTFGGWFYVESASATAVGLMSKYLVAGNQRSYLLYKAADGVYYCVVSSTGADTPTATGPTYTQNQWQCIIGRFDPSTEVAIFVDGTWYTNGVAIPAAVFDSGSNFNIGAWDNGAAGLLNGRSSFNFLCAADIADAHVLGFYQQTRPLFGV